MLARRFTIVCLLTLLFALAFANLVTATKSGRHWENGTVHRCSLIQTRGCINF